VKKGFVALLVALAVVVLVSPGIIGRLAEQSVDENLDWAGNGGGEVLVTSTGFDRGWFTSAGQHRIELTAVGALPALIIDTRLDHGLIPVSSMNREHGSLMPELGSAVSTLSVELADGTAIPVPATIFSNIGLNGGLKSRFTLEPEGVDIEDSRVDWGGAEFLFATNPGAGSVSVVGALDSLAVESEQETAIVGKIDVDVELTASGFGLMVGPAKIELESFAIIGGDRTVTAGPMSIDSAASIDGGRLDARLNFHADNIPVPLGGLGSMHLAARLENVDAAALGDLKRNIEAMQASGIYSASDSRLEKSLMRLLSSGLKLHFDQIDVSLPMGQITSRFSAVVDKSGDDNYTWTSALLALDASADISLPVALVDTATQANPDLLAAIGMGFLRKKGGFYTMQADFKQGLLTVNGAPMPIPLPGLQ